jgi:hypothetical protein
MLPLLDCPPSALLPVVAGGAVAELPAFCTSAHDDTSSAQRKVLICPRRSLSMTGRTMESRKPDQPSSPS